VGDEVLEAWDFGEPARREDADGGLINKTWWVRGARGQPLAVMQQLNTRIFRPEVHEDIEAVTSAVAAAGLGTPRLVRTRTGSLWHTDLEGAVYRCLTVVGERTVHKLTDPADARAAARFVARFHAVIRDLPWQFRMVREGIHDTERHFAKLRTTLADPTYREHRLYAEVAALGEEILAGWAPAPTGPLPSRVVHGDLKISNVRFAGPEAVALVDLDTFQRSTLDVELGDAMRSWCNPAREDSLDARFDVELFEAAMAGYAQGAGPGAVTEAEWEQIITGIERICWELASRFAQDALAEQYFGFDPKYGGRGEHNLVRAQGQAALGRSVRAQQQAARAALARARKAA
jgi:Ser/Thr protein kinase RdoA (MazF antagonist)